jgi:hypothetical protein
MDMYTNKSTWESICKKKNQLGREYLSMYLWTDRGLKINVSTHAHNNTGRRCGFAEKASHDGVLDNQIRRRPPEVE